MTPNQDDAMALIEPILKTLHDCLYDGMAFYLDTANYNSARRWQQRERTVAGCVNDHTFHKLRESRMESPVATSPAFADWKF